jgi:hypothetical protein
MRKVPVLLAAAALLLAALPSAAWGHAASRYTDDTTYLQCDRLDASEGTLSFVAMASPAWGADAALYFWDQSVDPEVDPPSWVSGAAQVSLGSDGLSLGGTIDVYEWLAPEPEPEPLTTAPNAVEPWGDYVGQASLDLTFVPVGDPQPFSAAYGRGSSNQQLRYEGTDQWLAVSGEIVLPGDIAFTDLASCMAVHEVVAFFATQPDAFTSKTSATSLGCEWTDADRYVYLDAYAESGQAWANLYVSTASGEYMGGADAGLTSSAFSAAFDLYTILPPESAALRAAATGGGDELAGTATASAALASTAEHLNIMDRDRTFKFKVHASLLSVDGSLTLSLPDGDMTLAMDDATCYASDQRVQTIQTSPAAQTHGKPLPNDLPENATPIGIGSSATVRSTAGTAPEPEAPCTLIDPEFGPYELPIGHTAWWTFQGSGGEVTVDTAGSTFDTIVGIYTDDGGSYAQVACVDDVETPDGVTLQAAVTVVTDAGVTYYVQVGGYDGDVGRLQLAVS